MSIRMIAFLGNPGSQYTKTRHNSGMLFFSSVFRDSQIPMTKKFHGLHGTCRIGGEQIRLLLPQTYMNESGKSVGAMSKFFSICAEEILVVHDDLELPFTKVTLQKGGGLGGHNGLRSIVKATGSKDFFRLRIGISRPGTRDVSSYVLSRFSKEEEPLLDDIFHSGYELIKRYFDTDGNDKILPISRSFE